MEPTELPFTIGSKVWVNHEISNVGGDKPYHQAEITGIEISAFEFFKNNRMIIEDKPEHKIALAKVSCRLSLYPLLNNQIIHDYWLIGDNAHIFLNEQELLNFRAKHRS